MAKRGNKDLVERMRAAGLRKKVAVSVAEAMGSGPRKSQPKALTAGPRSRAPRPGPAMTGGRRGRPSSGARPGIALR